MKAWIYQDRKQVAKNGPERASWYVGWIDPAGRRKCKSCGPGAKGKQLAARLADKRHAELVTGTYRDDKGQSFAAFAAEYETRIASAKSESHRSKVARTLDRFAKLTGVKRFDQITTRTIDQFVAARRSARGKRKGDTTSAATINLDLRYLKAAFRVAVEWGLMPTCPKLRMERMPRKLPVYVPPDHFAAIYLACDAAHLPGTQGYTAGEWWRAFLAFAYMTGWRVGEILSLRRADVNFETGYALTRAEDNKAKTDELVKLHPVVVEHLRGLVSFGVYSFEWPHDRRTMYDVLAEIQTKAEINLPCEKKHEHTQACHHYSFHDFRRAFATMNADRLSADALQKLMRHQSYQTTQVYIAMSRQIDAAVASLHVPEVLQRREGP